MLKGVLSLVLAVGGTLAAQVQVFKTPGGQVKYHRSPLDPVFRPEGIGAPPKGADIQLWYAYDPYIRQFCDEEGVDPVLAKAVIWCESRFQWRATSRAKARGLMQVIDSTARSMGANEAASPLGFYDPIQNLRAGIHYIARLQTTFDGNLIKVVAAYNAGEKNVLRHNGIPPFKETRSYVPAVLQMWDWLHRGV